MTDFRPSARVAAEFRLHPLGFFYLQDRIGSDPNRRIHVWLPDIADPRKNDAHQHSYDINSSVLLGRVRSELFRFRETPTGVQREFAVSYEDGRSILSPTGRIGDLELLSIFDSVVGTSYFLRAGAIHRVKPIERPCVTMLITDEHKIPIYSYGTEGDEPPFARRLVNSREAHQIQALLNSAPQELLQAES